MQNLLIKWLYMKNFRDYYPNKESFSLPPQFQLSCSTWFYFSHNRTKHIQFQTITLKKNSRRKVEKSALYFGIMQTFFTMKTKYKYFHNSLSPPYKAKPTVHVQSLTKHGITMT